MNTIDLGAVSVVRVPESENTPIDARHLFTTHDLSALEAHRHWLEPRFMDADGRLRMNIQAYVVKTRHHTILVDACVGNDKARQYPAFNQMRGPWLQTLAAAGVTPEQVDFVMCTHLHFDHVGWNTRLVDGRWVPTFPNAKYLFARPEWEYWKAEYEAGREPYGSFADSVLPVMDAGKGVIVEADHGIDDEVWLEHTPGHTPGHVCVHVGGAAGGRAAGGRAIMTGDLMHHPIQCAIPHWEVGATAEPEVCTRVRRGFLERNADSGRRILTAHFVAPDGGFIRSAGEHWRYALA
ncbi:MAG TPA: MBL fold metallo-hydrolase [Burkholderiales bacterium]|nr:MBL fold metallo-hydrolase [Burkholderiales bacterium]